MCGILGIVDPGAPVSADLYRGAMALQHRGQDGAGITTFDKRFHHRAANGLLAEVFRHEDVTALKGRMGLAHLRYATAGTGDQEECQPFMLSFPFGLALVHNGNLTNDAALRQRLSQRHHRTVTSSSDSETLMHVFAGALANEDLANLTAEGILRATREAMAILRGSYSVIVMIANHGLLAFRDPQGFRPLIMGRQGEAWAFASESVALDAMDLAIERDVHPGEAVFVSVHGQVYRQQVAVPRPAHCVFEYIYLARPESVIDGRSVSEVREALGSMLASRSTLPDVPDVVFDVPSSAEDAAIAFARTAHLPYRKGIRKNHYCQRSFIASNQAARLGTVSMKFLLEKRVIAGKRVAVIDDSIVRGTTARSLIIRLRQQGAHKVYFFSASPPVIKPCIYGIDMAIDRDLVAATRPLEAIGPYMEVDHLQYQTLPDLLAVMGPLPICTACFTGTYPTEVDAAAMAAMGSARAAVSGETAKPRLDVTFLATDGGTGPRP